MVMSIASNLLNDNVRILKDEVSRTAYQGVTIAISKYCYRYTSSLFLSYWWNLN